MQGSSQGSPESSLSIRADDNISSHVLLYLDKDDQESTVLR